MDKNNQKTGENVKAVVALDVSKNEWSNFNNVLTKSRMKAGTLFSVFVKQFMKNELELVVKNSKWSIKTIEKPKYSVNQIKLSGDEKIEIAIPEALILDTDCDVMRVAAFAYLYVRRGQDDCFDFCIERLLEWLNRLSNRHKGGINDRIISLLEYLKRQKYISYSDDILENKNLWKQFFRVEVLADELPKKLLNQNYAYIYWDEVLKIVHYQNENNQDAHADNLAVLLLFAYLRLKISKQSNEDETNIEAWDGLFVDIAQETGLSVKKVSECVKILSELDLIYYERLSRFKVLQTEYRTDTVIFVNKYRREGDIQISSGEDYYLNELRKQKEKIEKSNRIVLNR